MPTQTSSLAQFGNSLASGSIIQADAASPYETSFGSGAGAANTGARNTFIGFEAGKVSSNAVDLTATGFQALANNTTGSQNTAIGAYAQHGNLIGLANTAVGYYTMVQNYSGSYNCAFGALSLYNCTSTNNSAFGVFSLYQLTTGGGNTALGINAGYDCVTGSNITCLGYNANPSSSSVSNQITLGDSGVSTLRCATTTITSLSDARDKKNIVDLAAGLAFVNGLRPVAFDWHTRDEAKVDIPDTGFLAQDLQQVQVQLGVSIPGLVFDDNPEKLEAGYSKLLPVLVKAIQELSAEVKTLKAQIA